MNDLTALRDDLRRFASERDWDQFHSPKNLAMALVVEAGELLEHFQWLTESESRNLQAEALAEVEAELGDVLIYLIRIADKLQIDLPEAAKKKLSINEAKYPKDVVRGSAKKYTKY